MADAGAFSGVLGAMTLIKTVTASDGDATVAFEDGSASVVLDSTYPIYRITISGAHPEEDAKYMTMQFNAAGGSGYDETITSTFFRVQHMENDSGTELAYYADSDQAQGTDFQRLVRNINNDNDSSAAGWLRIFNPSSTTFVKHFISRCHSVGNAVHAADCLAAGYFNTTSAIDEIQFKMNTGDIDAGDICLYGIN